MSGDEGQGPTKRQRIARACNHCRRRKLRCDGGHPCSSCRANDLSCEYAGNRMNSNTYINQLEDKVSQLEKLLYGSVERDDYSEDHQNSAGHTGPSPSADHDVMETIVDAPDEEGEPRNLRNTFGGLSVLDRLHKLCGTLSERQSQGGGDNKRGEDDKFSAFFDLAPPEIKPTISWDLYSSLPSREKIHQAIHTTTNISCCTLQFLDKATLHRVTNEVHEAAEAGESEPSHQSMCLVFAVLALAKRCEAKATDNDTSHSLRYFRASRALLDPANCQDAASLMALICMALYTQGCSMMSTSHSYICMAIAAALHLGIFDEDADHSEKESHVPNSDCVAAVLFMLDAYITTALGLPRMLREINVGSWFSKLRFANDLRDPKHVTYYGAQLASILGDILESVYPEPRRRATANGTYGIKRNSVVTIERQLAWWFRQMDDKAATSPQKNGTQDESFLRSQLLLRLYHSHVEIVLYRPFIHHTLRSQVGGDANTQKAHECGSACIKASMQVVWLVEKLEECGLFNAAYWLVTLIIAFSATCLVLYVKGAQAGIRTETERETISRLRRFCSRFSDKSSSLRRTQAFLEAYFPEHGEDTPSYTAEHRDLRGPFDDDLTEFQRAIEQNYLFEPPSSAEDDVLAGMVLPNLQSFVGRSL